MASCFYSLTPGARLANKPLRVCCELYILLGWTKQLADCCLFALHALPTETNRYQRKPSVFCKRAAQCELSLSVSHLFTRDAHNHMLLPRTLPKLVFTLDGRDQKRSAKHVAPELSGE